MGKIVYKGKTVTGIYFKNEIENLWKGSLKIFEKIKEITSCFGMGYWINEYPWRNEDGWKNN